MVPIALHGIFAHAHCFSLIITGRTLLSVKSSDACFSGSTVKKNDGFIPQGIQSNSILTGERVTVKLNQEIQVKGDLERTTYKYLQILKTIIFYLFFSINFSFFNFFQIKPNTFEMTMSLIVYTIIS